MTAARLAAALFVLTAAAFVVGVSTEPDDEHDEAAEVAAAEPHEEEDDHDGAAEPRTVHDEEADEETILGVDADSPGLVAAALIVSLAMAALLWLRGHRAAGVLGVVAGVGFAVFDVAELVHQADESRAGFALLAGTVAVGHLAAAAASGRVAWQRS